ncbi:hypothetical protein [Cellulomonas palmilytica]|uniref:hypothetical protein n=1 Tax=Cellulomonas palmilytica TaxID=2608402 RepID=UPI001F19529A|nr:hypothetical protein [Cellulomonas palmilytica]UJP40992.1 hypothetical protein F1D97_05875 [Cellulomonas palmilytica]
MTTAGPSRRFSIRDDEHTARIDGVEILRASLDAQARGRWVGNARCVVETLRLGGGQMPRALLGGSYAPDLSGRLVIEVETSGVDIGGDAACASRLSSTLVRGLPLEFALSAQNGLLRSGLGSGLVRIDRAGFDPVESSGLAFELTAELLAVVLEAMAFGRAFEQDVQAAVRAWP